MNSGLNGKPSAETSHLPVLVPGVDFDQQGRQTPLKELLQMEGIFPLSQVAGRLPFQMSELYRWARKGPFASCFEHVRSENGGKAVRIRVNLAQFSERFAELIQQGRDEDSRTNVPYDPTMDDVGGLPEVAEWLLDGTYS